MKDFINTFLPYYSICLMILIFAFIVFKAIKENIMTSLGVCIHLRQIDMVVYDKEISRSHGDGNKETTYHIYLKDPDDGSGTISKHVSKAKYYAIKKGDIIPMHETVYKYKDLYFKRLENYSSNNIKKYNNCPEDEKDYFESNTSEILHKCDEYSDKIRNINIKFFIFAGCWFLSIFVLAFLAGM